MIKKGVLLLPRHIDVSLVQADLILFVLESAGTRKSLALRMSLTMPIKAIAMPKDVAYRGAYLALNSWEPTAPPI